MKVKDLIERLQEMNPEAVVHIYDPDFGGFAAVGGFVYDSEGVLLEPEGSN